MKYLPLLLLTGCLTPGQIDVADIDTSYLAVEGRLEAYGVDVPDLPDVEHVPTSFLDLSLLIQHDTFVVNDATLSAAQVKVYLMSSAALREVFGG